MAIKHLTSLAVLLLIALVSPNSNADVTMGGSVTIGHDGSTLYDIYNTGTECFSADDGSCGPISIGFDFDWQGQKYTRTVMGTNGCLKLLRWDDSSSGGSSCSDYTPQALPYQDETLYPFWTDLIRGTGTGACAQMFPGNSSYSSGQECSVASKMMYQTFDDYVVFGWYFMQEYNRPSSNSFEVILNDHNGSNFALTDPAWCCEGDEDTFEFRYRELDIENHNVVVGAQFDDSNYIQAILYTNDSTSNWDSLDQGTLEDGGVLKYNPNGEGQPSECVNNPGFSQDCEGYSAYQFGIECVNDVHYSQYCPGYAQAYEETQFEQQCDIDQLSDANCPYYAQELQLQQDAMAMMTDDPEYYDNYIMDDGGYSNTAHEDQYGYEDNSLGDDGSQDGTELYDDAGYNGYDDGRDAYASENEDCGACGYDPREDMNIQYDDLNPEQQMLVDQGLSLQDAVLITMGEDDLLALGLDPSIQFNGHDPGDIVDEQLGESYDYNVHNDVFDTQEDWLMENDPQWALEEQQWQSEMEGTYGENWEDTMTMADWYEVDVAEFGQEQVDEWYGTDVAFDDTGTIVWEEYDYSIDAEMAYDLVADGFAEHDDLIGLIAQEGDERSAEDCPTCAMEDFFREHDDEEAFFELYDEDVEFYADETELYDEDYAREEEFTEEEFTEEDILEDFLNDEAFEELINEEELAELIMSETDERLDDIDINEERDESRVETEEDREEDREDTREKSQSKSVNNIASSQKGPVTSNSGSSVVNDSGSSSSFSSNNSWEPSGGGMSMAVSEMKIEFSDSATANIVEEVLADGSGESVQVMDGSSQQDGSVSQDGSSSFQNDDGSSSSSSSSSTGQLVESSSTGDDTSLLFAQDQLGQSSIDISNIDAGPSLSAFDVAEEFAETQTEQEEAQMFIESFDDGSSGGLSQTAQDFGDNLTDAIASGTGLTEFLSQEQPTFTQFEVQQQTFQEQKQTDAVESLADRMGSVVASANLATELQAVQQGTGDGAQYGDQTIAVAYIGYTAGFSDYTSQMQLADQQQWYGSDQVYPGQKNTDNVQSFYMMAGKTQEKLKEMIYSQYKELQEN